MASFIPGNNVVNTIGQIYPSNATTRPNTINGTDLKNSIGSFPKTMNEGLAKQLENIREIADTFEDELAVRGFYDYRAVFDKDTIPEHTQSLSKMYLKASGIDEDPTTAAVSGLEGWDPKWNEVAITASSVEITTHAYGRFYKKHKYLDKLSIIDWYGEIMKMFVDNAAKTMNNLAGIKLYEGSNKIFVKSIANFNPQDPDAARITLESDASKVAAPLHIETLKYVKYLFNNYEETYNIVDPGNGSVSQSTRKASIPGYQGDTYLVLVGRDGYEQVFQDQTILNNYVVNGGYYAQQHANDAMGIQEAFKGFKFQVVQNPLTISKEATPKVSTTGNQPLECAFVLGGGNARIGIELTLEGSTQIIQVNYDEDRKLDVFGLLAFTGWFTVTDFSVIRNEALYCIPYIKSTYLLGGTPVAPAQPTYKK